MANSDFFCHPSSFIDNDVEIGDGTQILHFSHLITGSKIGHHCNIGHNVVIGPDAVIGDSCKIRDNVCICKGVTLESGVFCGASVTFTNLFNPRSKLEKTDQMRPTLVKRNATLGANCTIICGVTIGAFAFVGAGAVVTKDVPDYALVYGNPARQAGWVCACGDKLDENLFCNFCRKKYHLSENHSLEAI